MRIFKTSWFNKAAKKAHIKDSELRIAIDQVISRWREIDFQNTKPQPTSRALRAGSSDLALCMDPANKSREVGVGVLL